MMAIWFQITFLDKPIQANKNMKQKIFLEALWIALTIVILCLILLPIWLAVEDKYPFYIDNILLIVIAITFGRYIFFLKHHGIVYSKWFKLFFVFFPVVIFFYLMDSFYDFQRFADEEGIKSIMQHLANKDQGQMAIYIKTEMILFWSAAFLGNILLPFKMIRSIWRKKNKGID